MKNEKVAKGRIIGLAGPCFKKMDSSNFDATCIKLREKKDALLILDFGYFPWKQPWKFAGKLGRQNGD